LVNPLVVKENPSPTVINNGKNHPNYKNVIPSETKNPIVVKGKPSLMALDNNGFIAVVVESTVNVYDMVSGSLIGMIDEGLPKKVISAIAFELKDGKTNLYIAYTNYISLYNYNIVDKKIGFFSKDKIKALDSASTFTTIFICDEQYLPIRSIAVKDGILYICGKNIIMSINLTPKSTKSPVIIYTKPAETKKLRTGDLLSIAFDRNGQLAVADFSDKKIIILDGSKISREINIAYSPFDFVFDFNDNIIVACKKNALQILNYSTGKGNYGKDNYGKTFFKDVEKKQSEEVNGIVFDGSGRLLVSMDKKIQAFSPQEILSFRQVLKV
jgi:WD40 repeat protein